MKQKIDEDNLTIANTKDEITLDWHVVIAETRIRAFREMLMVMATAGFPQAKELLETVKPVGIVLDVPELQHAKD